MGKKWESLVQKDEAYANVLRYAEENNVTIEEAYDNLGFYDPKDRLTKRQIVEFSCQLKMAKSDFLPVW